MYLHFILPAGISTKNILNIPFHQDTFYVLGHVSISVLLFFLNSDKNNNILQDIQNMNMQNVIV